MSDYYRLEGHSVAPCDFTFWWKMFEANRPVADDRINDVRVSTVFLGLDHSFGGAVPILFKTMIFGGPHDQFQDRYATWDEAEAGHKRVLAALHEGRNPEEESHDG